MASYVAHDPVPRCARLGLHYVVGDGQASVPAWGLPGQGHRGVSQAHDLRSAWEAGDV